MDTNTMISMDNTKTHIAITITTTINYHFIKNILMRVYNTANYNIKLSYFFYEVNS